MPASSPPSKNAGGGRTRQSARHTASGARMAWMPTSADSGRSLETAIEAPSATTTTAASASGTRAQRSRQRRDQVSAEIPSSTAGIPTTR